jgi:hypothetical protein
MEVFKKMWPDATMHDILRVFIDRDFRRKIARSLNNKTVRRFLDKEFERFSFGYRADGTAPFGS